MSAAGIPHAPSQLELDVAADVHRLERQVAGLQRARDRFLVERATHSVACPADFSLLQPARRPCCDLPSRD